MILNDVEIAEIVKKWRNVISVSLGICDSTIFILEERAARLSGKEEQLKVSRDTINKYIEDDEHRPSDKKYDNAIKFIRSQIQHLKSEFIHQWVNYSLAKASRRLLDFDSKVLDINNKTAIKIIDVSQVRRKYKVRNFLVELAWDFVRNIQLEKRNELLFELTKDLVQIMKSKTMFSDDEDPAKWKINYNDELELLANKLKSDPYKESLDDQLNTILKKIYTEKGESPWEVTTDEIVFNEIVSIEDDEYNKAQAEIEAEETKLEELINKEAGSWDSEVYKVQEKLKKAKLKRDKALEKYYQKHKFEKWLDDAKHKWNSDTKTNIISEGTEHLQKYFGSKIGKNLAKGNSVFKGIKVSDLVNFGMDAAESLFATFPGGIILHSFISGLFTGWMEEDDSTKDVLSEKFQELENYISKEIEQLKDFISERIDSFEHRSDIKGKYIEINSILECRQTWVKDKFNAYNQGELDSIEKGEIIKYFQEFNQNCITPILIKTYGIGGLDDFINLKESDEFITSQAFEKKSALVRELLKYHQDLPLEYPVFEFYMEVKNLESCLKSFFITMFLAKSRMRKILGYLSYNIEKELFDIGENPKVMFNLLMQDNYIPSSIKEGKRNKLGQLLDAIDRTLPRLVGVHTSALLEPILNDTYFSLKPFSDDTKTYGLGLHKENIDEEFGKRGKRALVIKSNPKFNEDAQQFILEPAQSKEIEDRISGNKIWIPEYFLIKAKKGLGLYGLCLDDKKHQDSPSLGIYPPYNDVESTDHEGQPISVYPLITEFNGCLKFISKYDKTNNENSKGYFTVFNGSKTENNRVCLLDKNTDGQTFKIQLENNQVTNYTDINQLFPIDKSKVTTKYLARFIPGKHIQGNLKYYSENGQFYITYNPVKFKLQIFNDGDSTPIWESNTEATDKYDILDSKAIFKDDGNLAINIYYNDKEKEDAYSKKEIFSSDTHKIKGTELILDDTGILIIKHTLGGVWFSKVPNFIEGYDSKQLFRMHIRRDEYDYYGFDRWRKMLTLDGAHHGYVYGKFVGKSKPIYTFEERYDGLLAYTKTTKGDSYMWDNTGETNRFYLLRPLEETVTNKFYLIPENVIQEERFFTYDHGKVTTFGSYKNNPFDERLPYLTLDPSTGFNSEKQE